MAALVRKRELGVWLCDIQALAKFAIFQRLGKKLTDDGPVASVRHRLYLIRGNYPIRIACGFMNY